MRRTSLRTTGGILCNWRIVISNSTVLAALLTLASLQASAESQAVNAGSHHTCAITAQGGVKCWGHGGQGQLGDGDFASSAAPVDVEGLSSGVTAIASGGRHTCALTTAGAVKCWGYNAEGQLGDNFASGWTSPSPVAVSGLSSGVVAIAAGGRHTCALTSAGAAKCWGSNPYGELGNGGFSASGVPVDVSGLGSGVAAISVNGRLSCALTTTGGVKCWGRGYEGQLGNGSFNVSAAPVDVSGLSNGVLSIAAGGFHACAVTSDGAAKCWGRGYEGQLGNGTTGVSATPVDVTGLSSGVSAITVGGRHACALTSAGSMKCWGYGYYGELGDGSYDSSAVPLDVSGLSSGVAEITAGGFHTCARTTAGVVKCWGYNYDGQVGTEPLVRSATPVEVVGLSGATSIGSSAYGHTCAVTSAGGVKCWGRGWEGQLGNGSFTSNNTAVDVSGLTSGVVAVAGGGFHACALTAAGGVKCWGYNGYGQLGDAFASGWASATPVDVPGLSSGVTAIAAGGYHTCALTSAGGIKCWGASWDGQLGSFTWTSTPVDITGLTSGVAAITAGYSHSCALTTAGGVKCWGRGWEGELGNNVYEQNPTPVTVSGLSSGVTAISAGFHHTCALTGTGSVKCWGYNAYGQLGTGTFDWASATPVDVNGLSGVAAIAGGGYHSCALTTSGGVKCWGGGWEGQLGNGSFGSSAAPVDVSGLSSGVSAITAGWYHSCALLTTGDAKCWGANWEGQLGSGQWFRVATPTEVKGLSLVANRAPVALCKNVTVAAPPTSCSANIAASDIDNGSSDPDAGDTITRSLSSSGPFGLGSSSVTLLVTDSRGASGSCTAMVTVVDQTLPTLTCPADIIAVASPGESSKVVGFSVSAGDNCSVASQLTSPGSGSAFAVGTTTVASTATDGSANSASCSFAVTVLPPLAITSFIGPSGPVAKGVAATVTASFGGGQGAKACAIAWDDGSTGNGTITLGTNGTGNCSASHAYAAAGVYEPRVTITDGSGSVAASLEYVVVYDASAGFVTGGGWIHSPAGAYSANRDLAGKASFGFVSKYLKGATVPSGETQFQFHVAGFDFKSTVYEWLVISGSRAQFKGSGKINGAGDHGFLLTTTDGDLAGGGGADKFRIKVWDRVDGRIVYDNAMDTPDDINGSGQTTLGGGNITIKK